MNRSCSDGIVLERLPSAPPANPCHDTLPTMHHSVFHSFQELGGIAAAWDAFVENNGGDLYSSFDWCRVWWEHYGDSRELEIHVFEIDKRMVGLIPAFRETLRLGPVSLRLVRLLGCDHSTTTCGVVIAADQIESVIAEFSHSLAADAAWDMVQWGPLAGYFQPFEAIAEAFSRSDNDWIVQSSMCDGPHIIWELPRSNDEYLAGLSKKERSNIKIARKKTADDGSIVDAAETQEELQHWFPVFLTQHQKQWQAEGMLGHFADWPKAESFHQQLAAAMAAKSRLWLLRLDIEKRPIGFQYNYRFGRRIHWLLGSRDIDASWDAYSSGRVLHAETIERAIAEGCTIIDGLRGLYEYKLRLGGKVVQLQSISLIRRRAGSKLRVRAARFLARCLDLLYYRIWFSRIAPRLPIRRRGLWRLWIRSRI